MKNETKTTVTFEHRVAVPYTHECGTTFEVGEVLERTTARNKRKWYGKNGLPRKTWHCGDRGEIPAENVVVFKITRTTVITETEEIL